MRPPAVNGFSELSTVRFSWRVTRFWRVAWTWPAEYGTSPSRTLPFWSVMSTRAVKPAPVARAWRYRASSPPVSTAPPYANARAMTCAQVGATGTSRLSKVKAGETLVLPVAARANAPQLPGPASAESVTDSWNAAGSPVLLQMDALMAVPEIWRCPRYR